MLRWVADGGKLMAFGNAFQIEFSSTTVIVYPDETLGMRLGDKAWISKKACAAAKSCSEKFSNADYAICFAWLDHAQFMADLWTFSGCETWGSGPLADVTVIREEALDTSSGVGSGNSLVVLGLEETLRRSAGDIRRYLASPRPQLPSYLALTTARPRVFP